jgi:hypothetical protein
MLTAIITLLIYICLVALVIYLVLWVLQTVVGLALPAKVIQILWVIFALIVVLLLVQIVLGGGSSLPRLGRL